MATPTTPTLRVTSLTRLLLVAEAQPVLPLEVAVDPAVTLLRVPMLVLAAVVVLALPLARVAMAVAVASQKVEEEPVAATSTASLQAPVVRELMDLWW